MCKEKDCSFWNSRRLTKQWMSEKKIPRTKKVKNEDVSSIYLSTYLQITENNWGKEESIDIVTAKYK